MRGYFAGDLRCKFDSPRLYVILKLKVADIMTTAILATVIIEQATARAYGADRHEGKTC